MTTPTRERRRSKVRDIRLGGQRVDLLTHQQALGAVESALDGKRRPLWLASANLDHVYRFEGEADLFEPTDEGQWLVLLDGMPLVWATNRRTGTQWERLTGADLLPQLLGVAERRGERVGFVGGTDELKQALPAALEQQWPELDVAGHWTPPREVVEDPSASADLATEVADADVDLLVVGLGKPRQERWIRDHAGTTGCRVACAFGAAADFIAGRVDRAPDAIANLGGEWLYRLYKEPRRLAKRYLAEGPVAMARVLSRAS